MRLLLALSFMMFIGGAFAQKEVPKTQIISFKTSAVCGECKERIEKELNYTKGVIYAELDIDTKILTVKFKSKHLNQDLIKNIVSNLGYDAGEYPRNPEAFKKLPKCCKSEGHCKRD